MPCSISSACNDSVLSVELSKASTATQLVDVYVQVDKEEIQVMEGAERSLAYRFSGAIRSQLNDGICEKREEVIPSCGKVSKEKVTLSCKASSFPGPQSFRPIATWMRSNQNMSAGVQWRDLKPLLPPQQMTVPFDDLVNTYAAAILLELPLAPKLEDLICNTLFNCPSYVNASTVRFMFDRLGAHNDVIRRLANVYWIHVHHDRIARGGPEMDALMEQEPELADLFSNSRKERIERMIAMKLERGVYFPEDVPHLIL